jgi:hypothetical protein
MATPPDTEEPTAILSLYPYEFSLSRASLPSPHLPATDLLASSAAMFALHSQQLQSVPCAPLMP